MAQERNNAWLVQEREAGGQWVTLQWLIMAEVTHINGNELAYENRWDIGEAQAALIVSQNKLATPSKEHRYIADWHPSAPEPDVIRPYVSKTYGKWQS